MSEEWRPVVGYEGLYEVSDLGRVRSLPKAVVTTAARGGTPHVSFRRERIMKPAYRMGYAGVSLSKDGRHRIWRVSRLVLFAFVGPPVGEATLSCHRDGNQSDDNVANLYWGTPQQNVDDMFTHGNKIRSLTRNRIRPKQAKVTINEVRGIKLLLAAGRPATVIARDYGVSVQLIRMIQYGRTWRKVAA